LLTRQRVIDLLVEIGKKQVRQALPEAITAVREIIADPEHRDRLKAT
jgi:hypothetical protein